MRVLSEATAAWLQRLMNRETGRVVSVPPDPQGGKYIPPILKWLYIADATAIDTSVTNPSLTKDYFNAVTQIYEAELEDWRAGTEVYVTTPTPSSVSVGYAYAVCVGKIEIDEATKLLYMPVEFSFDIPDSGSGSGSGSGTECENVSEVTFRECDPDTGEQTDVTITFPNQVRVCRTPVGSGG